MSEAGVTVNKGQDQDAVPSSGGVRWVRGQAGSSTLVQVHRTLWGTRLLGTWAGWIWRSLKGYVCKELTWSWSGTVGGVAGRQTRWVDLENPASVYEPEVIFHRFVHLALCQYHIVLSACWNWQTWVLQSSFCFSRIHRPFSHWMLFWTWESALIPFLQNRAVASLEGWFESECCLGLFCSLSCSTGQMWWHRSVIEAPGRWRQGNHEFKAVKATLAVWGQTGLYKSLSQNEQ